MEKDVIELGVHEPSVESVISRLSRFQDKIKHITVIVEWEDESGDVFHDTKDMKNLCYDTVIFNEYVKRLIFDEETEF